MFSFYFIFFASVTCVMGIRLYTKLNSQL
uniref:Uncharacterized protein n=1 Tax=Anguilla anguilla TaxID=7936 RepID=A0A0E9QAD8_ANGAN